MGERLHGCPWTVSVHRRCYLVAARMNSDHLLYETWLGVHDGWTTKYRGRGYDCGRARDHWLHDADAH